MTKYKVRYYRTVNETYEAIIEAETEDDACEIVEQAKYGDEIEGEILIESYSDYIEIDSVEEHEED